MVYGTVYIIYPHVRACVRKQLHRLQCSTTTAERNPTSTTTEYPMYPTAPATTAVVARSSITARCVSKPYHGITPSGSVRDRFGMTTNNHAALKIPDRIGNFLTAQPKRDASPSAFDSKTSRQHRTTTRATSQTDHAKPTASLLNR